MKGIDNRRKSAAREEIEEDRKTENGYCYAALSCDFYRRDTRGRHNVIGPGPLNMDFTQITIRPLKQALEAVRLAIAFLGNSSDNPGNVGDVTAVLG